MNLASYFDRIGYRGRAKPDLPTLTAVLRAHVEAIPYENLDVQLGRPVTRALPAIFEKIVGRWRGGWCYEMNGLFSWALEEIGFKVVRLAGGVFRETAGDSVVGNHLVPLVDLSETYLADAGFGNGPFQPQPLREGQIRVGPMLCELKKVDGGWWRYVDDEKGGGPSFDFHPDVRDERLLEDRCRYLQTDPASPFVLNAVVQRWLDEAHYSVRGRVLTKLSQQGRETRLIEGPDDYVATLKRDFALDLPDAARLWPKIAARHEVVMQEKAAAP
ncbi:MAG: arylamine N-acetyltransferase [Parvularculaceae bacterium]